MTIVPVSSIEGVHLEPYRTLRRQEEHRAAGIFVAEGEKVVRRLLASRLTVLSLLLSPSRLERLPAADLPSGVPVYVADDPLLHAITGYRMHQGMMAVGRIPPEPEPHALLRELPRPFLLAALDGVTNAENVGVLVRSCAAFGVQCLLVGATCCSPWLRRAVRNSMGGVFTMPIIHCADLAATLDAVQRNGDARILVTDAHEGLPVWEADLRSGICVVFGEEEAGVSAEVAAVARGSVRIPMDRGIDSLNVASAGAAVLYEVRRQRSALRP